MNARLLNTTFEEIRAWMDKNPTEFLMFYFDDQPDLQEWGKVGLVMQAIDYHFGSMVFTPSDMTKLGRWPSLRELQQMSKRVLFASRTNYGSLMNSTVFWSDALWNEFVPDNFAAYPSCTVAGISNNGSTVLRILGDSLIYGPFFAGYHSGLIVPDNLAKMVACNTPNFVSMDQVSPVLAKSAVWTWAPGEPRKISNGCAAIGPNGRWMVADCDSQFSFVCAKPEAVPGPDSLLVSSVKGSWKQATCPSGYQFSLPRNGYANTRLVALARGQSLWINLTDF